MKVHETFLALYREYETLVRNKGIDPKDYEGQVDELTGARLNICRIFRNYLSHKNDPGFLEVSQAQIKFMQKTIHDLNQEEDILKKHVKTVAAGTCTPKDKCADVLQKFAKLHTENLLVISDPSAYSFVDIYSVALSVAESKSNKIDSCKQNSKGLFFATPEEKMENLPVNNIIICTQDGTATGKFIGVYYPKK